MLRQLMAALVALAVLVGGALGAEGVVVKYTEGKLVLKVDGKEKTIEFKKGRPHVHGVDGKKLKMEDYPKHLKAGVKLDIEEEGGKIVELTIKK